MRRRVGREIEPAGERHGRRAVLDAEDELAVAAAEIEVAIAPSVQVPRAAQRLAVRAASPGVFAQVVEEDESELVRALERARSSARTADISPAEFSSIRCRRTSGSIGRGRGR